MYAFQLFHKQHFDQAFAEFNEFLTDPAEIVSLFSPLSANTWLLEPANQLIAFIQQHRHFSEPNDFVGIKFENALHELQRYLTDLRRVFQTVFRRAPDTWLEVRKSETFLTVKVSSLFHLGPIARSKSTYITTCTRFINRCRNSSIEGLSN